MCVGLVYLDSERFSCIEITFFINKIDTHTYSEHNLIPHLILNEFYFGKVRDSIVDH